MNNEVDAGEILSRNSLDLRGRIPEIAHKNISALYSSISEYWDTSKE